MIDPIDQNNYASLSKEEIVKKIQKYKEIIDMFSNTIIGGVAKMDATDMSLINANDGYYKMTGYAKEESHLPPFSNCGLNLVLPEDVPRMQEKLEVLFTKNEPIRVDYRIRKKDGTIAWNTAFCPGVQHNNGHPYIEVFFLDTTQEKKVELQLTNLINNMPGGLVCMQITDDIHILYANDEFYSQCGYTEKEFKKAPISNNYLNILDLEDIDIVQEKLQAFLKNNQSREVLDYRIIRKDGKTRWIRAYLSPLYGEASNEEQIQCVLTDITREREREQRNKLNEERFRIISEQTRDVIFDWDIEKDSLRYSPVFKKMFGYNPPNSISTKELLETNMFYEEDKPLIQKMIDALRFNTDYVEVKTRLRKNDGSYFWALHRATAIQDKTSKYRHVIGIISDVNDIMENTLDLQRKAEHDSLTGLLNRITAQHIIEETLQKAKPEEEFIFIQFDIDRFKQINDFMGHAAGDFALQKIAQQMRETFRSDDHLIRMGGDEFAIFMSKPLRYEKLIQKIDDFVKIISSDFKFEEKIYPLSISAGIAFYPRDSKNFEELYKHADIAMYLAKRNGGNQYQIYEYTKERKGNG